MDMIFSRSVPVFQSIKHDIPFPQLTLLVSRISLVQQHQYLNSKTLQNCLSVISITSVMYNSLYNMIVLTNLS